MSNSDTPIPEYSQHFSPRDIAKYFHNEGADVGRKYKTHGEIWSAPIEHRKIGLLHLILEELQRLNKDDDGWITAHREWLTNWQPWIVKLHKKRDFHINRIDKMMGVNVKSDDMCRGYFWTSLPWLGETFIRNRSRHKEWLGRLEQQVKRLASVKKPEHIIKLQGIGKVTAAKILSERNLKCKSKKKGNSDE